MAISAEDQRLDPSVEKAVERYKSVQGALIPILQEVQNVYGYLPKEVLRGVSKELKTPLSKILGVATFYSQFSLEPKARNPVKVCHGTACHVSGAAAITKKFEETLGIKENEATADKKFSLERVNCLGCCSLAPVVMVNQDTHGWLTPDKVKEVVDKYD